MKSLNALLLAASGLLTLVCQGAEAGGKTLLADGWAIQSSAKLHAGGDTISTPAFTPADWYPATVPSTVVGNLVQDKVYPDPFSGMNFRSLPGVDYPIGANFSGRSLATNSPFKSSWWYRKEFNVSWEAGGQVWLNFEGINYRANLWLNGQLLADTNQTPGAHRTYQFNITPFIPNLNPNLNLNSSTKILAVEILAPNPNDLAITWVDWNPAPPDKNMGLWRDVYLTSTGPVALHDPQAMTPARPPHVD